MTVSDSQNISDIYAVYYNEIEKSGNVERNKPIPLDSIELNMVAYKEADIEALRNDLIGIIEQSKTERKITKPDPIAALFCNLDRNFGEGDQPVTLREYQKLEQARVQEKWRSNRIGYLNELISALLPNIEKSSAGQLDLIVKDLNGEPTALVEVKNRFNTMNAGSLARLRTEMDRLVLNRGGTYTGCEAILAERIPKTDGKEQPYTPSNNATGARFEENEKIKRMGLDQFLSRYDKYAYLKGLVFIAQVMSEQGALPSDYDMSVIFELMNKSMS